MIDDAPLGCQTLPAYQSCQVYQHLVVEGEAPDDSLGSQESSCIVEGSIASTARIKRFQKKCGDIWYTCIDIYTYVYIYIYKYHDTNIIYIYMKIDMICIYIYTQFPRSQPTFGCVFHVSLIFLFTFDRSSRISETRRKEYSVFRDSSRFLRFLEKFVFPSEGLTVWHVSLQKISNKNSNLPHWKISPSWLLFLGGRKWHSFTATLVHGILRYPPMPIFQALLRDYQPSLSLDWALFLGEGWPWGGPLRLPNQPHLKNIRSNSSFHFPLQKNRAETTQPFRFHHHHG